MKIGILSIGDEVLSGSTLNTNAHFIAKVLADHGYPVLAHLTTSDDKEALQSALEHLFGMVDCVISTGGLGPTCDDLTREIVADYFEMGMRFDQEVAMDLRARFGDIASLDDQSTMPERAVALPNETGTAPGLWFEEEKGVLVLLPGVPSQMRHIMEDHVVPRILEKFPLEERLFSKTVSFFGKSENDVDPIMRSLSEQYPDVQFGIYPSYGILSVKLSVVGTNDQPLQAPAKALKEAFNAHYFADDDPQIERALQRKMIKKGLRLGLAESCTGGAFAARLTAIADSSLYFEGSIVSYSNAVKKQVLGVSSKTLEQRGAVSEETVLEMVSGVHRNMHVDVAVSVSGIAGPSGGTEEKPVGTIWAAIEFKDKGAEAFLIPTRPMWRRDLMITYTINYLIGAILERI